MQKRILFVDDEPNILQGLRRMLRSMRHEWDMVFAESASQALELLTQRPFDVVVSDMRMPGMDGAQLLAEVRRRYPQTVRIILSGHSDQEMILRCVGPTHQYLGKPCDADTLKAAVTRACALRELSTNEALTQLIAGIQTLPCLPTLYLEVVEAIQAPHGSLETIGRIIERDMGMSAKILQLVNSAFFGVGRQVSNPAQAVGFLGLDIVKALILSVKVFAEFDATQMSGLCLDTLWHHSVATAAFAKHIATMEHGDRKMIDDAFMAGLLHDTGKLIFAAHLPHAYSQALRLAQAERMPLWEAERIILGASHAEVGAYLLGLWGLPDPLVEALAFHHRPSACPHTVFSPLTAVHAANALAYEGDGPASADASQRLDHDYLLTLGLSGRFTLWREYCETMLAETS